MPEPLQSRLTKWWANTPEQKASDLEYARHYQLCTAIPFPRLNWADPQRNEENLEQLYGYAEILANSVIDWYIRKRRIKKLWSITFRFFSFAFAIAGTLIPLLKIAGSDAAGRILKALSIGPFQGVTELPAELALVLIGVAAGFNLVDRFAGFSSGWMRYTTVAMRISEELMRFQFQWNDLERNEAAQPRAEAAMAAQLAQGSVTPVQRDRIELVQRFCFLIFAEVNGETSAWADELKNSLSHLTHHIPGTARPQ